ncbi:MAG TPA: PHP domain-containing protein [Candidatus Binataceae bacterium]|jgi:predicted metal-dependent phosphoesterase TrpH|nr:PHP domain-containing protein [Candidatus Binataceae bacterium]
MIVDIHVHTHLSDDSKTTPDKYVEAAIKSGAGLGAICFTEHRRFPRDAEIDRLYAELAENHGIVIIKGIEADTDLGHLLLFGVNDEVARRFDLGHRMLKSAHLIDVMHKEGGIAIPAHPFRDSGYGVRLEEMVAKHGAALSAIEAVNGQNSPSENERALAAVEKLGLTALGGSDAHFPTPHWFLTCATELERDVKNVEEFCIEVRAGRARPYQFPRP